jgi:hypothetical protein
VSCGVDLGAQVVGSTWKKIVNDPAKDVLVALLSEGLFCVTCDDFVDSVWTRVADKLEERGSADPPLPSHMRMVEPIQTRWTCTYSFTHPRRGTPAHRLNAYASYGSHDLACARQESRSSHFGSWDHASCTSRRACMHTRRQLTVSGKTCRQA